MVRTLEPQTPIITDPIGSYEIGDDTVILLGASALVSSKSNPGHYWEVDALLGSCSCPSFAGIPGKFEGRGKCRHVDATKQAQERDRETAQPVPAVLCSVCGKRPPCMILGRMTTKCARCTLSPGVE